MVDPEDTDYKCTLTEYSLQKSIKELNEDPKQRLGAVQTLRKWIRDQPHYNCRTDTRFLLTVLRRAKFSQLVARELINNIMTMRTSAPEYITNLDLQEAAITVYIDNGIQIYPPKLDKEGRRLIIIRAGLVDLKNPIFSPINEVRTSMAMAELSREESENGTVNGIILFFDCTNTGIKHINQGTMEQNKIRSRLYQDSNPERAKAFIIYNAGAVFELLMAFMKAFLKKKNQERVHTCDTMEAVYKIVPMELWPTEYLPDDYKGPSAGSIASIIAETKKKMTPENRARILSITSDKYKIDESKRPADAIPQESFRKLNTD